MKGLEDQIKELQLEVERLQQQADRYHQASDDCLQELAWCIGFFAASHKPRIAQGLAANVTHIRRGLLHRQDMVMPTKEA
jgi:hypothetical protein